MDRLVFLLPGDPSNLTGGYVYDRRISEGLRGLGWEVDMRTLHASFPEPMQEALSHAERTFAEIPNGSLVLIDGLALGALPTQAAAQSERLRLVGLVHHPLAEETGLEPSRTEALRVSERRALTAAGRVVATSRYTARLLEDYGVARERISVVEPGTDPAPLARGSGSGTVELLCVATVTPRKGHAILLEALSKLRDRDFHLTCVGSLHRDPGTAAGIRNRIQTLGLAHKVSLTGELDDAALATCYERSDVFVLPTLFEGYGMSLAEAVARGLPVVSTLAGAVPETLPPEACLLVPPGDAVALSKALSLVLDSPDLRSTLAAGASAGRSRLPTWREAAIRMAEALRKVTAG